MPGRRLLELLQRTGSPTPRCATCSGVAHAQRATTALEVGVGRVGV